MTKRDLIAAGYAVLLPISSTIVIVLVAVGVEGAVSGFRRLVVR